MNLEQIKQEVRDKCGNCLFAEGGDRIEFKNGDINYQYECSLRNKEGNIVFLEYTQNNYVWENQNACKDFEIETSNLKPREDLNEQNNFIRSFACEGYFEIL